MRWKTNRGARCGGSGIVTGPRWVAHSSISPVTDLRGRGLGANTNSDAKRRQPLLAELPPYIRSPYRRGPVSDETKGRERRVQPRVPITLKVEYKRLNSFFADYTRNISRGGTFIRTANPLAIGTEFMFQLAVPSLPDPLTIRGKVQWIVQESEATEDQEPGMGIGFVYDSEADRDRIANTVEKLMVEQLGPVLYRKLMGKHAAP
ncbi:MAG TPA: TIGR02266 family protein [Polyangiaceae bacterium]|nr:TIGR02266 family protein [Polyangiaceae bacterium]